MVVSVVVKHLLQSEPPRRFARRAGAAAIHFRASSPGLRLSTSAGSLQFLWAGLVAAISLDQFANFLHPRPCSNFSLIEFDGRVRVLSVLLRRGRREWQHGRRASADSLHCCVRETLRSNSSYRSFNPRTTSRSPRVNRMLRARAQIELRNLPDDPLMRTSIPLIGSTEFVLS